MQPLNRRAENKLKEIKFWEMDNKQTIQQVSWHLLPNLSKAKKAIFCQRTKDSLRLKIVI